MAIDQLTTQLISQIALLVESTSNDIEQEVLEAINMGWVDHKRIKNRGSYSHTELDAHVNNIEVHNLAQVHQHIGDSTIHFKQNQISHSVLLGTQGYFNHQEIHNRLSDIFNFVTPQQVSDFNELLDHTLLKEKGINTHNEIDRHIANIDPDKQHITSSGISLNNIKGGVSRSGIPFQFNDHVTIKELTVLGGQTIISSIDMAVKDNIIELNKDETGDGVSKGSAGIFINRGTATSGLMIWQENGNDGAGWYAGTSDNMKLIILKGDPPTTHTHPFTEISGTLTDIQHGNRTGGNLHSVATTGLSGFMSGQDKQNLNTVINNLNKIKANLVDQTAGYLSDKIDNSTLEIYSDNQTDYFLRVKEIAISKVTDLITTLNSLQSQIDNKVEQTDYNNHINNNDIHYVMSSIQIAQSQVSGLPSRLSTIETVQNANKFGQNFQYAESNDISTTIITTPTQKVRLSAVSIVAGTYRIGWSYAGASSSNQGQEFGSQVILDKGTGNENIIASYLQKTLQAQNGDIFISYSGHKHIVFTLTDTHTIDIEYYTTNNGKPVHIKDAHLEFWRIS